MCSSSEKYSFIFSISAGNKNDAQEGRKLINRIYSKDKHYLLADRAYEDNATRKLSKQHGFEFIVPPKKNRKKQWKYDKELYKRRNEIERYFCRLKRFRRFFTGYEKLDKMFIAMINLAMIFDALLM